MPDTQSRELVERLARAIEGASCPPGGRASEHQARAVLEALGPIYTAEQVCELVNAAQEVVGGEHGPVVEERPRMRGAGRIVVGDAAIDRLDRLAQAVAPFREDTSND